MLELHNHHRRRHHRYQEGRVQPRPHLGLARMDFGGHPREGAESGDWQPLKGQRGGTKVGKKGDDAGELLLRNATHRSK